MEHNITDHLYNLLLDEVIQELSTNVGIGFDNDTLKSYILKRFVITRHQYRSRLMLKIFHLEPQLILYEIHDNKPWNLAYASWAVSHFELIDKLISYKCDKSNQRRSKPKNNSCRIHPNLKHSFNEFLVHDNKPWNLAYASWAVSHFELIDKLISYKCNKSNQRRSKPKNNSCRIHPNLKHSFNEFRVLNNKKIQSRLPGKNRSFSNSRKDNDKEARCNQITISKSKPINDLRISITMNQTDLSHKCVAYIDGGSQKTWILQRVTFLRILFYIVESLPDLYSQIFLDNDFLASINAEVLYRANGSALRINDDIIPSTNFPISPRGNPIKVYRVMTQS
uniref:DUF1758 domain-containing protein n=1 Tax=Strongyloides venezuelensis TaxID=75913 RepID=A0A0K0G504_STRVS